MSEVGGESGGEKMRNWEPSGKEEPDQMAKNSLIRVVSWGNDVPSTTLQRREGVTTSFMDRCAKHLMVANHASANQGSVNKYSATPHSKAVHAVGWYTLSSTS
ncbi:hypothetical protein FB451DRAFT_1374324 [Mycena latifolia]|nr:hypothetical protein FB451DRAFT_1381020 [Mycena latifolia]KAJ7450383.1 hypothetical protein FB451DRAFT_1374738 [Mycena latifolia]KAJ7451654.1 hypothetical protein FB451DRAFT_1374324 [Mycena latifolia]